MTKPSTSDNLAPETPDVSDVVADSTTPGALLTHCSPQQFSRKSVTQIMQLVMVACIPGIAIATYFFGIGIMVNIALAMLGALFFEALLLLARSRPVSLTLSDNSALVTAMLLGVSLPPGAAWWLVLSGVFVAIVIAKQVFGGLGQNPFNPAMCGYAFLLLSFPLEMTSWHIPLAPRDAINFNPLSMDSITTSLRFASGLRAEASLADGLAMATPLLEQKLAAQSAIKAILDSGGPWVQILERDSGSGWELVNMAYLAGGLFLLARGIISWHIPLAIIGTITGLSILFYSDSSVFVFGSTYLHLFGSATMLGAFFIATDPASAASTPKGKLLYGVLIGASIYSIRVWGSYLDSVAFAVLFGNLMAPLIDKLTLPRPYGHVRMKK